jgi:23S rRNA G2445 N2-methylase RlmL
VDLLHKLFIRKPYLAWFVKDKVNLSKESQLEQIFNYGDWQDYLKVEKTLGINRVKSVFEKLKNQKRTNLRSKTVNYFNQYFAKYAR